MHAIEPRSIAVTTHGRYLARTAAACSRVVVGFHGYAESADVQMERLATIPEIGEWTVVSVQGLHRFYRRRSDEVVASWMTRQDREQMIADNVAYVSAVLDEGCPDREDARIVVAGFSQGVAMAFRAACLGRRTPAAVVALGGDVPPELGQDLLCRSPRVLLGRGREDPFYREPVFVTDLSRLRAAGVPVEPVVLDGGHEWTPPFAAAVAAFLRSVQ